MNQSGKSEKRSGSGGRVVQLDILRGIAILLVMVRHWDPSAYEAGYLKEFFGVWKRFGWTGVSLFFVLSGYLIGGLLFQEIRERGQLDVSRFLTRRMLKIWPSWYVFLAVYALVLFVSGPGPTIMDNVKDASPLLIACALNVQNYFVECHHLWSLAVEEHFYLGLPILLAAMLWNRRSDTGAVYDRKYPEVLSVGALLMVACLSMRVIFNSHRPYYALTHLYPTHLRIDELSAGVMIAYVSVFYPSVFRSATQRWKELIVLGCILASPFLFLRYNSFVVTWGLTLLCVAYSMVLVGMLGVPISDEWRQRSVFGRIVTFVAWIGTFSYPIYLWHELIGSVPFAYVYEFSKGVLPDTLQYGLFVLMYLVVAISGGVLASKLVEVPTLAFRDRWFPSRTTSPAVTPVSVIENEAVTATVPSPPVLMPTLLDGTAAR